MTNLPPRTRAQTARTHSTINALCSRMSPIPEEKADDTKLQRNTSKFRNIYRHPFACKKQPHTHRTITNDTSTIPVWGPLTGSWGRLSLCPLTLVLYCSLYLSPALSWCARWQQQGNSRGPARVRGSIEVATGACGAFLEGSYRWQHCSRSNVVTDAHSSRHSSATVRYVTLRSAHPSFVFLQ